MESIYEIHLWNPFMESIYRIHLWNPFMESIYEIHLLNPFMESIYEIHLWIPFFGTWSALTRLPCTLVPGEPREVTALPVNSSTILVSWQPPLDTKQNGIIRAYQIYIQPKKTVSSRQGCRCAFIFLLIRIQLFFSMRIQIQLHKTVVRLKRCKKYGTFCRVCCNLPQSLPTIGVSALILNFSTITIINYFHAFFSFFLKFPPLGPDPCGSGSTALTFTTSI